MLNNKMIMGIAIFAAVVSMVCVLYTACSTTALGESGDSSLSSLSIGGIQAHLGTGKAAWDSVESGYVDLTETGTQFKVVPEKGNKNATVKFAIMTSAAVALPDFYQTSLFAFEDGDCLGIEVSAQNGKDKTYYKIVINVAPSGDPGKNNFHIYLAFGQSNMMGYLGSGGAAALAQQYTGNVPSNFMVMPAGNKAGNTNSREKGTWYPAVPPLNLQRGGLSPADFFGRTIAAAVADRGIKVGVIVIAVDGCAINLFSKNINEFKAYIRAQEDWMRRQAIHFVDPSVDTSASNPTIPTTDFNTVDYPYKRLLDMAKLAQEEGVIKGIIMHQGESGKASYNASTGAVGGNGGDNGNYAAAVRAIYNNLLADLGLAPGSIPFLAGQAVGNNNSTINSIPAAFADIPGKMFIIPSDGCTAWNPSSSNTNDKIHFSLAGYEELGRRYGNKMLELLY